MMRTRTDALTVLGLITLLAAPTRGEDPPARAAGQLADQLKRHPARLSKSPLRRALYMMDLAKGDVTMIADEPDPTAPIAAVRPGGRTTAGASSSTSCRKVRFIFCTSRRSNWETTPQR